MVRKAKWGIPAFAGDPPPRLGEKQGRDHSAAELGGPVLKHALYYYANFVPWSVRTQLPDEGTVVDEWNSHVDSWHEKALGPVDRCERPSDSEWTQYEKQERDLCHGRLHIIEHLDSGFKPDRVNALMGAKHRARTLWGPNWWDASKPEGLSGPLTSADEQEAAQWIRDKLKPKTQRLAGADQAARLKMANKSEAWAARLEGALPATRAGATRHQGAKAGPVLVQQWMAAALPTERTSNGITGGVARVQEVAKELLKPLPARAATEVDVGVGVAQGDGGAPVMNAALEQFAPLSNGDDTAAQSAYEELLCAWIQAKADAKVQGVPPPRGPFNVEQRRVGLSAVKAARFRVERLRQGATPAAVVDEMAANGLDQIHLMYGPGGTGKSSTIGGIQEAISSLGLGETLVTAYTGVAAAPFGGPMLLSLFNSNPQSKSRPQLEPFNEAQLEALQAKFEEEAGFPFKRLAALVIDEVSFIDATLMGHIEWACRWLSGNRSLIFGGIVLILSGDNCQKPPPGGTEWHVSLVDAARGDEELCVKAARPDSAIGRGMELLRRGRRVCLQRIMRAVDDKEFASAQQQLRRTDVPEPAAAFVKQLRLLSPEDMEADEEWLFAPIGVLAHCERDNLNVAQLRAFAKAFGLPIFKWKLALGGQDAHLLESLSERDRAAIYSNEVALWGWFVEGCPILLSSTIRSTRKLVNGSPALLDSLSFADGEVPAEVVDAYAALADSGESDEFELVEPPYSVNVRVSGAMWHGVPLDDLSELVDSLASDAVVVPLLLGKKDVEADLYHIEAAQHGLPAKLNVRAHTYILAFALTDFKVGLVSRWR